jgi:hypothetical protein
VPPDDTKSTTGTSQKGSNPDDFKAISNRLRAAHYQLLGLGFVLEICRDRTCADALESVLSLGTSKLIDGTTVAVNTLLRSITEGVKAAASAVGGWVAFCVVLRAAYWALMVHCNKTPLGVVPPHPDALEVRSCRPGVGGREALTPTTGVAQNLVLIASALAWWWFAPLRRTPEGRTGAGRERRPLTLGR